MGSQSTSASCCVLAARRARQRFEPRRRKPAVRMDSSPIALLEQVPDGELPFSSRRRRSRDGDIGIAPGVRLVGVADGEAPHERHLHRPRSARVPHPTQAILARRASADWVQPWSGPPRTSTPTLGSGALARSPLALLDLELLVCRPRARARPCRRAAPAHHRITSPRCPLPGAGSFGHVGCR